MPISKALRVRNLAAALSVAALVISAPAHAGSLALTFGDRSITVSGATVGGDVAFFGTAKEPSNSAVPAPMKTTQVVVLHDDDHDGNVTFTRQSRLPLIAIWVAVDLSTGQWAASGSPGFEAQAIPPEDFVKRDDAGHLRKLSALVPGMDVLLVRPRTGAWQVSAAKTSAVDENGRGADALQIDVSVMIPVSPSLPKLESIHPGDVIALIEPLSMRFAVVEVHQ